jgi:hypothetical protein
MVDQLTVAYLRSQHAQPSKADLDQLIAKTTRVQIMEMVFDGHTGRFQPRLEFTSRDDLSGLGVCLAIEENSSGHLMMIGELLLEFYHVGLLIARVEIVGTGLLRWPDRWKEDAPLTDPIILADFLKSRGYAKLRESIDRDEIEASARIAADAAWLATWEPAIPAGLGPLVDELLHEIYAEEPRTRPRAMALLKAQYPSDDKQILALFAWLGHGSGPWSGFPWSEAVPEFLLECFATADLLHALENQALSRQHLEGAARFISRWVSKPHRQVHQDLVNRFRISPIRQPILEYVQSTGDPSRITAVARILA